MVGVRVEDKAGGAGTLVRAACLGKLELELLIWWSAIEAIICEVHKLGIICMVRTLFDVCVYVDIGERGFVQKPSLRGIIRKGVLC